MVPAEAVSNPSRPMPQAGEESTLPADLVHRPNHMPNCINITDPRDPRLSDYFDLSDPATRQQEFTGRRPWFICEGEIIVRSLLESNYPVRSLLCTPGKAQAFSQALSQRSADTPVYVLPRPLVEGVTGFDFHRGVLASGARPEVTTDDLARILSQSRAVILLEEISNFDNLGSVFRNAACLAGPGVAVLLTPGCCDPFYRKAIRVSMGHVFRTPHAQVSSVAAALPLLRAAGFTTLAFTPAHSAVDLEHVVLHPPSPGRLAFLFGNEGAGLTPQAMESADIKVRIPMAPGTDSINIATSCAIALYRLCPVGSA